MDGKINPVGQVSFAVLICAVAAGLLWLVYYLMRDKLIGRIKYERSFDEKGVFEGESCIFTETITNTGFMPLFGVRVESYFYKDLELDGMTVPSTEIMQYAESRFTLLPYMQIKRSHTVKCLKRGFYAFEAANLIFFGKEKFYTSPTEIYVYPKLVPLEIKSPAISSLQGDYTSRNRLIPDPFNQNGIRDYLPGDSFSMINFKATARSISGIKVNNYNFSSSRTVLVFLNFQINPEQTVPTETFNSRMENGLAYAASMISEALENGNRVGFAANCTLVTGEKAICVSPQSSRVHLTSILQEMAMARIAEGVSFCSLLDRCVGGTVSETEIYILSTFENDEVLKRVDIFRKQGNSVQFILL